MTKQELLDIAKEAYYNTGKEIMTDMEYDRLEEEVGLENKNYIGSRHNEQYTVKHPMVMGSLSKVQIKKDNNEEINWTDYANEINSYLNYYNKDNENNYNFGVIITPKYDGCSFEIHMKTYRCQHTFSTRGDGEYGKDIKHIFLNNDINYLLSDLQTETLNAIRQYDGIKGQITDIVFRGEVLIDKNLFEEKYKDYFANPRAFVAGTINAKFDDEQFALLEQIHDLSFVIYDVRYRNKVNNKLTNYKEFDWQYVWAKFNELKSIKNNITFNINTCGSITDRYNGILNLFPDLNSREVCVASMIYIKNNLEQIYNNFEIVRKRSNYALDGFVIKPVQQYRHNNNTEARPKDCVAVKFLPIVTKTKVIDIEWSTGKTNELVPTVIVEPIELDGKTINRVSGHNFGYIYNNGITEGSELEISLAGDIIPFIYKVDNNNNNIYKVLYENNQLDLMFARMSVRNINASVSSDMIHLYKVETETETKERNFIQRTVALGIKSLAQKNAEKLAKWALNIDNKEIGTIDYFFNDDNKVTTAYVIRKYPNHLFELFNSDIEECFGGKTAQTVIKDIERAKRDMTLPQIIQSCCFRNCGPRASEICACIMVDGIYDTTGIEYNAIAWAFDENSEKYQFVLNIIRLCNKTLNDYKEQNYIMLNDNKNKTFVILTGEPNQYESKSDFLCVHPEYEQTTSWKKCQIVFTNDLNSNTGKMKKARDYISKGYKIEIKEY